MTRRTVTLPLALGMTLLAAACGGEPTPSTSDAPEPPAASTAAALPGPRKPAGKAELPQELSGWKANGPIEKTTNIETGSYSAPGKTEFTIVSVVRDTNIRAKQMFVDMQAPEPATLGEALCADIGMTADASPTSGSVICLVDLDGGILNVTGPGDVPMEDYANFASALYESFPAS